MSNICHRFDMCHTAGELRTIRLTEDTPTAPPGAPYRRRVSRLPVLAATSSGAVKEVADGCRLHSASSKVGAPVKRLESFQPNFTPSPRPPAAPKRTPSAAPKKTAFEAPTPVRRLASAPPTVPCTQKRLIREATYLIPAKGRPQTSPILPLPIIPVLQTSHQLEGKKTASECSPKTRKVQTVELQPLSDPAESLSLSLKLLSSHNWMKEIEGLKIIRALAQHHAVTLRTKLHEVCLVLIEQVRNLHPTAACAAMNTLVELYVHLQKAMDPEVEGTGRAVLLKLAQTTNAFTHEQANLTLDAMVENCSHGRILTALFDTGLSHRCAAVRGSMALHLHQLADNMGAAQILTATKSFTERFITAVSKLYVDAAPDVRYHGRIIVQELVHHKEFLSLWNKIVPEKERWQLNKILKKAKV